MEDKKMLKKKVLVILRGISGSGKSYLSNELLKNNNGNGKIYSTDEFFIKNGSYQFNPKLLGKAHIWNQTRAFKSMDDEEELIIIDNTNTCKWEAKAYVKYAVDKNYEIIIKETTTEWAKDADILAKKNQHGVPKIAIQRMLKRWENDFTVENILNSKAPFKKSYKKKK